MKPIYMLIIGIIVAIYLLSPIDIIPDIIPIVGWIDDLIILIGGIYAIRRL